MTFDEVLDQVRELLHSKGQVTYRALKRRFELDDDYLDDLKAELIKAEGVAADGGGEVLVWTGAAPVQSSTFQVPSPSQSLTPNPQSLAERRQLTVMFCDLVGSTALSGQLDPEELREVVRDYQETCTAVIRHYDGQIAQHLGDGLLVYFGYPVAHEDDAARAVRAGLEIITALQKREPSPGQNPAGEIPPSPPLQKGGSRTPPFVKGAARSAGGFGSGEGGKKLHVRLGIHTGLVVIGEIGNSEKSEMLALGETPNLAARIQGQANPDEVLISAATYHLVEGLFAAEDRGQPELKGVATPLTLYRVLKESDAHSRFEVVVRKGLTPLIGREHEFGLLRERWERTKDGTGQVVLLSGEPGIGKSRLVEALKATVESEGARCLELRCSPYTQNSALAPVIEHLHRMLGFHSKDSPEEKLRKIEVGVRRAVPLQPEAIPLLAALLSLPHPDGYPPLTFSPQKQKEKTHEALVVWLRAEAKTQAMTYAWEDLHWADPSTLELLTLFLAQVPTTRLLTVLTFRPEFTPPWGAHSYLSQLNLSRLGRTHVETMVEEVTGGKTLPPDVIQQIVSKTDGVPLFVEELTKSVIESMRQQATGNGEQEGQRVASVPLTIPATLQDSLMARLDRLGTAKEIAQLGATLGREFNYDLLHAISPVNEDTLQQGLKQLVTSELVYQSGLPPQAQYLFKHALVQDTAYQSLLKSRRQQLHQTIGKVLEEQFPQTVETQPELVAHHYTEAGLAEQAISYWQRAGERASQCSAYVEAINHFTRGLELLETLPDTPERAQQELTLLVSLGPVLITVKGFAAPEVERTYARAQELCQQVGETPQLFPVLAGLVNYYDVQGEHQMARKLGEQFLNLAQRVQEPALLLQAHHMLGGVLYFLGEFVSAHAHLKQGISLYDLQPDRSQTFLYGGHDPGVCCLCHEALLLWLLGYPDQALKKIHDALGLARELSHFHSLALALLYAAGFHAYRWEVQAAHKCAEELIVLSHDQGFPIWAALGTAMQGWALAEQGQGEEGIAKLRQGLAAYRATGAEMGQPHRFALLAKLYGERGQVEEGLAVLAEALTMVDKNQEHTSEAELYRLKGELLLMQAREQATVGKQ